MVMVRGKAGKVAWLPLLSLSSLLQAALPDNLYLGYRGWDQRLLWKPGKVPERKDFEITWVNYSVLQERILKSREGERDEQNHSKGSGAYNMGRVCGIPK